MELLPQSEVPRPSWPRLCAWLGDHLHWVADRHLLVSVSAEFSATPGGGEGGAGGQSRERPTPIHTASVADVPDLSAFHCCFNASNFLV